MKSQVLAGPIAIPKNTRETLRLSIDRLRGRTLVSARIWFVPADSDDARPGYDGFAIDVSRLPAMIAGLQELEVEAVRLGLLEPAEAT